MSPGVERLATLCGANADRFDKAAELLQEASGIHLSESTVERTTEAAGERIAEHLQAGRVFGGKQPWDWHRDANGKTVGYIEIDATGVPQQGIRGEKAEGRMLDVWEKWNWSPSKASSSVREEVLGYFRNPSHRMDYPSYEANGWFIGSGAIESACKTVVNARLKGTGMRWSESGSHALCHVRALYRSEKGQWDDYWERILAC